MAASEFVSPSRGSRGDCAIRFAAPGPLSETAKELRPRPRPAPQANAAAGMRSLFESPAREGSKARIETGA